MYYFYFLRNYRSRCHYYFTKQSFPSSVAPANVTSFEGAGSKNVAGALVGVVAIAAAMM